MKLRKNVAGTVNALNNKLQVVEGHIVVPDELIKGAIDTTGVTVDELKRIQGISADIAVGVNIAVGRAAKEYFNKHKDADKITYSADVGKISVNGRVYRESTFNVVGTNDTVTHQNHVSGSIRLKLGTTSSSIREAINVDDIAQFIE